MSPAPADVLVVEDDLDVREAMIEVLTDEGVAVAAARHGGEALAFLKSAASLPKLILLDLMMPVMDGRQFRAEQLAEPKLAGIPVVLLTATGDPSLHLPSMRKPIALGPLLALIAQYVP